MKKGWLLVGVLAVLTLWKLLPFQGSDVAQLMPIRALTVDRKGGQIFLDGGVCSGKGGTLEEALADMKNGAAGTVFLATTEEVIVSAGAVSLLPELCLWDALRPATRVAAALGDLPDPEQAADYLEAHDPGVSLGQLHGALLRGESVRLPQLLQEEGGLHLVWKNHR